LSKCLDTVVNGTYGSRFIIYAPFYKVGSYCTM
jgi:hypothetical protein